MSGITLPRSFAPFSLRPSHRGDMGLWLFHTGDICRSESEAMTLAADLLDGQEQEQASAFRYSGDRLRYIAAHGALRLLLAESVGIPAGKLVFTRELCPCCGEPHGRPALAEEIRPPYFSLSHGGNLVMIGTASTPIGVDVEPIPGIQEVADLTALLHLGEQQEIDESAPADRPSIFTRLWTRKEAYLKCLGTGLGRNLDADYLGSTGLTATPSGWTVANVSTSPGYAAAFALEEKGS